MRAAVANGADAVYFGLSDFNARHRAANFTLQDLPGIVAELHRHNVRAYVAFNTLIFSDELDAAAAQVAGIARAGADAVIVQDLGLLRLIQRMAPGLAVHGSTQMTLTEPRGIDFVAALGVSRVILARELSLAEIKKIHEATPVPVETFVHGALCIAYSGQCLTSEALGGRSANRGQCAQACRLPYELIVDGVHRDLKDKAYLLSPQDLAGYDLVGELVEAGVSSLKIEGRLKSAAYVAATTQTYRAALDAALDGQSFTISPQQRDDLTQSFSRGFAPGFLAGVDHQRLVQGRFPKSRGIRVGQVAGRTDRGLIVQLEAGQSPASALKPGDGVVFDQGHPEQDEQGGRLFAVRELSTGKASRRSGTQLEITFGRGAVQIEAVELGSLVWKTDDPAMRRRLEHSFARDQIMHREPLQIVAIGCADGRLRIEATDERGQQASVTSRDPLQPALRHPLTTALLSEQMGRLGDSPFELGGVSLREETAGGVREVEQLDRMAPKSVLNDLRRQVVEALVKQRDAARSIPVIEPNAVAVLRRETAAGNPQHTQAARSEVTSTARDDSTKLTVLARTMGQLDAALAWRSSVDAKPPAMVYCDFEDIRQYPEAAALGRAAGVPVGLATLRIIKPGEEGLLRQIAAAEPDAVLARNLAAVSYFRQEHPELSLIGDYALNIANELTAAIFADAGLARLTPSYDLTWSQLAAMLERFDPARFEVTLHQHMPMFHMEHCVIAATLSQGKDHRDCGRPCDRHTLDLDDRTGVRHPLVADVGCRNTVFNGTAQSAAEFVPRMKQRGLRWFRVELLRESGEDVAPLLDRYARTLAGLDDGPTAWRSLRVLNQLGVTRGTLEAR